MDLVGRRPACRVLRGDRAGSGGNARRERVCAEVVAEHVGLATGAVVATWQAAGVDGVDVVVVRHGGTFHTCEVDRAPRVRALQHPDAG